MSTPQTSDKLSREEIARVEQLCESLSDIRRAVSSLEARARQVDVELYSIQIRCPHPEYEERLELDCAELKKRRYCLDCGAKC